MGGHGGQRDGQPTLGAKVQQRTPPPESQGGIHPSWAVFSAPAATLGPVRLWPLEPRVKRLSFLLAKPLFTNDLGRVQSSFSFMMVMTVVVLVMMMVMRMTMRVTVVVAVVMVIVVTGWNVDSTPGNMLRASHTLISTDGSYSFYPHIDE